MPSPYATEEKFDWDAFVEQYWDERPVLYKASTTPAFDMADVFTAAARAGRALRNGVYSLDEPRPVRVTVDRLSSISEKRWLPRRSDASFDGYHRRVIRRFESHRYALTVNALHAHSFPLWSRERKFFAGLWRRVGLPMTTAITTLFHGNYEHTPVGVHKDRFATFLFALAGRKRMRFWPDRPWSEEISSLLDYESHRGSSFAVDVEPGDILYWPSSYYHVGESVNGGVATSLNVGIPRDNHRAVYELEDLLVDIDETTSLQRDHGIARLLDSGRAAALVSKVFDTPGTLSPDLPPSFLRAIEVFREKSRDMPSRLQSISLRYLSAAGFQSAPKPAAHREPLDLDDRVRGLRSSPILWSHRAPSGCHCAANGHSVETSLPIDVVVNLLEALNSGKALRVRDLLARRTETEAAEMRSLLEALRRFRAIRRLSGGRVRQVKPGLS